VAKDGDTMTGTLTLPANGLRAGTSQLVLSAGNVGIGTATPAAQLDVAGTVKAGTLISDNGVNWGGASLTTDQGGSIELGNSLLANTAPYLDFHYGVTTNQDYNVRLVNSASNQLTIFASNWQPLMELKPADTWLRADRIRFFNADGRPMLSLESDGDVVIDPTASNAGGMTPSLRFGWSGSGEGIASKRSEGGNLFGLDFYTADQPRMSIANNGNVGIGTNNPQSALHVAGTVKGTAFIGDGSQLTGVTAAALAIPPGMALIPAGAFTMGDALDGMANAVPVTANISAFYMDVNEVSWSQWQSVYFWATNHGYGFVHAGAGKAANHPVQMVDWYDTVKWCNARSQQAGKPPVYYTDAGLTKVYTNGEVTVYANWSAKGYRLPTEAEWEKAARGGLSGQRFPWGNVINQNLANYYGATATFAYDLGPNGYHAAFTSGGTPYTSPVGSFAANGYGLYDMAGNVIEWCWDWYGTPYAGGSDPRGPASGSNRVFRGGNWDYNAGLCRSAIRDSYRPTGNYYDLGFRSVLPSGQ
jgi:formylglycine-generating enzyme required for sulfatase activity